MKASRCLTRLAAVVAVVTWLLVPAEAGARERRAHADEAPHQQERAEGLETSQGTSIMTWQAGVQDGVSAAKATRVTGWYVGGYCCGPVACSLAALRPREGEAYLSSLQADSAAALYWQGFTEGYTRQIHKERRRAVLFGFGAALATLTAALLLG